MNRKQVAVAALLLALLAAPAPAAAQEQPYGNETATADDDSWLSGRGDASLTSIASLLSNIGGVVVGSDPSDPGAGPLITGVLVFGVAAGVLGSSRAGLAASGTAGAIVVAALSSQAGAGLLPRWLFGAFAMVVALIGALVYVRATR